MILILITSVNSWSWRSLQAMEDTQLPSSPPNLLFVKKIDNQDDDEEEGTALFPFEEESSLSR